MSCDVDGFHLFQTSAHEAGHALGMQHSQVSGALMSPFYLGFTDLRFYQLPVDDTLGLCVYNEPISAWTSYHFSSLV